jgi:hypothetical protein
MTTQEPLRALRRALRPAKTTEEQWAIERARRVREAIAEQGLGPPEDQRPYWAMQTEADLDGIVRRAALALGYFPYHTAYSLKSQAGFPDWILLSPKRLVVAECKREGDLPRPGHFGKGRRWIYGQDEWLARFYYSAPDAGHETYLWWPSDAKDIVEILQTGPRPDMPCVRRTAIVAIEASETFPDAP